MSTLAWCKDRIYIHTHEGWLYFVVALDLYHHGIVGII